MTRAMDEGCLLVVAPAGYGKTLALQQAVEARGGVAAWYACRDRDADGGRLVVSILEARNNGRNGEHCVSWPSSNSCDRIPTGWAPWAWR
jgi:ATP/maltotriose-dependent transcriptional regulator MalT